MLIFGIVFGLCESASFGEAGDRVREIGSIRPLFADSWKVWSHMLALDPLMLHFDILLFYIRVLVVAPLFCLLLTKNFRIAIGVTVLLYALSQVGFQIGDTFLNVLAWQLLFAIGVSIGWFRPTVPRIRWLLALAIALMIAVLMLRLYVSLAVRGFVVEVPILRVVGFPQKFWLNPLRLSYFAALAYVVFVFSSGWHAMWTTRFARLLMTSGSNSLEVFAFGIVYTYVGVIVSYYFELEYFGSGLVVAGGLISSLLFGRLVEWIKRPVGKVVLNP